MKMMKMIRNLVIGLVAASLTLSAADLVVGTWKLNTAKSKYSPGPAPKSLTVVYSIDGDWVVSKGDFVDAAGKTTSLTNRYKYDGKEYPYKTAMVEGMISLKKIDEYKTDAVIKGKKGSTTSHAVISKDGKTRTLTSTGTNEEGKPIHNVAVYDKQ